jgi:hypothetical protein
VKTPREILLERHHSAEAKLDIIRQRLVAPEPRPESLRTRFIRDLLWPLRWHAAAMSALWLIAALLNVEQTSPTIVAASELPSSPRQLFVALAENRRQLAEMIDTPTDFRAAPQPFIPRRRSEIQPACAVV